METTDHTLHSATGLYTVGRLGAALMLALPGLLQAAGLAPYPADSYTKHPVHHVPCFETLCGVTIIGGSPISRFQNVSPSKLSLVEHAGEFETRLFLLRRPSN